MTAQSRRSLVAVAAVLAALTLCACEKKIEAPYEKGVCFHVVPLTGGQVKFNVLSKNRPNLESCAASLEGMRERFLGLGGTSNDIVGAYQGNFLFLGRTGVFVGPSLDGRLAVPSAMSQ